MPDSFDLDGPGSSRFNMADDNMIDETSQPTENGQENESPDDTEEDDDMTDDGKMCINHSAYRNKYSSMVTTCCLY